VVLRDARIRFIAIANPVHAPYGQAAVDALRAAGLYTSMQPRLVLGENISQTLQFVQTGNADIGIVALSLAVAPTIRDTGRYGLIHAYLHRPIRQAAGVTTRSLTPVLGQQLIAMVNAPAGRQIMRRHGFAPPGEGP
jgi:molybdate transport system substrate-binding protein